MNCWIHSYNIKYWTVLGNTATNMHVRTCIILEATAYVRAYVLLHVTYQLAALYAI